MPYRGGYNNYDFVIDSSFQPFTTQELLVPFAAYKDAYDKANAAYDDLIDKADTFKYLSETLPEGSKARKMYENYASALRGYMDDFGQNGLSMSNQRGLNTMRKRYQGEIGTLAKAQEKLDETLKLRREMDAKDPSRIYARKSLNIDDYLGSELPDTYGISGDALYAKGAAAGKSISSRIFNSGEAGSTLGGYYKLFKEANGISPDKISEFLQSPEVLEHVRRQMETEGVTTHLAPEDQVRAAQTYLNGMYEGIVYTESAKPYEDKGVLTPAQKIAANQRERELAIKEAMLAAKLSGAGGSGSGSGSKSGGRVAAYDKPLRFGNFGTTPPEEKDEVSNDAKKVDIRIENGHYVLSVGSGNNKLVLGSIGADGFTLGEDVKDKFGDHFNKSIGKLFTHTYDPDIDPLTIEALGNKIMEIADTEGVEAFKNYDFYLENDNASLSNNNGAFWLYPKKRLMPTLQNGAVDVDLDDDEWDLYE